MLSSILRSASSRTSAAAAVSALSLAAFATSSTASNAGAPKALDPAEFRAFKVTKIEPVTHDTKRVVFSLPTPEHEMGIIVASCILAKAEVDGNVVVRPYTPTSTNAERGVLELVVKGYATGKLSKHITQLQVGDSLALKGPIVKFAYKPNMYKKAAFIVGGSGLAPALQVIKEIVREPTDETEVSLIFANNTEADIILRDELDAMQYMYPQLKVHHVIASPSESWTGLSGFVSKEMIEKLVPSASESEIFVGVCGPPPMMDHISGNKNPDKSQGEVSGLLKELGYTSEQVFKF